jgi:hypothetical protein
MTPLVMDGISVALASKARTLNAKEGPGQSKIAPPFGTTGEFAVGREPSMV